MIICVSSVIWRVLLSKNNNTCGRAVRDSHPDLIRIWNLWFVIIIPKKWKKFKCIEWAFDVKWRSRTVFFVLCNSSCLVGLKIITWKIESYQGLLKANPPIGIGDWMTENFRGAASMGIVLERPDASRRGWGLPSTSSFCWHCRLLAGQVHLLTRSTLPDYHEHRVYHGHHDHHHGFQHHYHQGASHALSALPTSASPLESSVIIVAVRQPGMSSVLSSLSQNYSYPKNQGIPFEKAWQQLLSGKEREDCRNIKVQQVQFEQTTRWLRHLQSQPILVCLPHWASQQYAYISCPFGNVDFDLVLFLCVSSKLLN